MNTMSYKGFIGSVHYSEEDNVFHGKLEGINGLVTFEGDSVKELRSAFEESVDSYLEFCRIEGIEAKRSYNGNLNVRLKPEVHSRVAIASKEMGITINAFINKAVENQLAAS